MLIAQISDLHVRPPGLRLKDVVDSNRMLSAAVRHLNALRPRPALVLVTGDLTDHAEPEAYAHCRKLLDELDSPYAVIPGNHDRREVFHDAFADHAYLPDRGLPVNYAIEDYALVRIVAVDTTVPGDHHGVVEASSLTWLAETLTADRRRPTLVIMHHPPIRCGIPYLDQYRCVTESELARVINHADNVERVLCGHVHRPIVCRWAGTVLYTSPSTASQIALGLTPDAPAVSYLEPPACLLHAVSDGAESESPNVITHTSYIGEFEGPFNFA